MRNTAPLLVVLAVGVLGTAPRETPLRDGGT